jgi:hypothetical protein
MNSTPDRLTDHTAAFADCHKRHAALVTVMARHEGTLYDPHLLDMYLRDAHPGIVPYVKAAVAVMDVSSGLAPTRPMMQALLAAVDRQSVLGQLGAVKVPSVNASGVATTTSATAYWVGESIAKPVSAMAFAALSLTPRKVVAQVVLAEELMRLATESLNLVERSIVTADVSTLDTALLDPANAGTANVKPPSLTNGLTTIPPLLDFQNQIGQALNAISGGAPTRPTLVVSLQTALRLSALPTIANYVKVIVSPAAANKVIAIDADGIAFTDDGGKLDIGTPDLQMDDAPTSPSTASTVMLSTWQRNLAAIRLERWISWAKRADAVAYLTLA